MSARKTGRFYLLPLSGVSADLSEERYSLASHQVKIRQNGLEFFSEKRIAVWTELRIDLQSAHDDRQIRCSGVVVSCVGMETSGYTISLLFTNLTSRSQQILNSLKFSF